MRMLTRRPDFPVGVVLCYTVDTMITARRIRGICRIAAAGALAISLFAAYPATAVSSSWFAQVSGVPVPFNTVGVFTDQVAFAAGDNFFIWRTIDGGKTWVMLTAGLDAAGTHFDASIPFGSVTTAYLANSGGNVSKTTDAGASWTTVNTGIAATLYGAGFADDSLGWVVGGSATIRKTITAGGSWLAQSAPVDVTGTLYDVDAFSTTLAWAVGADGKIIKTTNGLSWASKPSGTVNTLKSISFNSDSNGIAVGSGRTVLRSSDGGETWTPVTVSSVPITVTWNDVYFIRGGGVATAVGVDAVTGSGYLITTVDSGATWVSQVLPPGTPDLRGISASALPRFAVGNNGAVIVFETTGPSTPGNLRLAAGGASTADTTPDFAWNASIDDHTPIRTYTIRLDGNEPADVGVVTTYAFPAALAVGAHTVGVTGYDSLNHASAEATFAFTITAADTTRPTVTALSMPTTATAGAPVTYSATFSDNVGVTRCELRVGGALQGDMTISDATASRSHTFTSAGTPIVGVWCYDAAGNIGVKEVTTTVSATAAGSPPTGNDTIAPTAPPALTKTSPDDDVSPTFTWGDSIDAVGVTGYEILLDSGNWLSLVGGVSAKTHTLGSLGAGSHTFSVRARDAAGNRSAASSITFIITVTASSPPLATTPTSTPAGPPAPTPAPVQAPGTAGRLIKLPCPVGALVTHPCKAVYFVGSDGKRHAFPNAKTYATWYTDFSSVVVVSQEELSLYPLGKNVTYRPGLRMIKFTTVPRVYVVGRGGALRWMPTEEIARALYGVEWNRMIDDVSDAFLTNYTFGADITAAADFTPAVETAATANLDTNF